MKRLIISENEKRQIKNLYASKGIILEQNEKPSNNDCVPVEVIGTFNVMVTEDQANVINFMSKLNEQINKDEKLKAAKDAGKLYISKINLIGGASNRYGGKVVKPTMDNNYNPKTYDENPTKYTGDFDSNLQLAKDRANNAWAMIQELLPKNNIAISKGVEPTIESYVIDTNGATDKTNKSAIDSGKFNPGQIVKMTIDLCGSGGGTDILKCFESAVIEVSYDATSKDQGHICDNAVYQMYANGFPLISISGHEYASLNNKTKPNDYPSDKSEGENIKGGTYEFNYYKLDIDGDNSQFFNQEFIYKYDGGLVVSAKCMKTKYGKWPSGGTDCHKWVGDIKLQTTSGVEVVNVGKSDLPNTGLTFSTPNMFDEVANVAGFEACKKTKTK